MFYELEKDNLKEFVKGNKKVIVQYAAGWCGNCKIMKPKFKRHANEYEDIVFVMVDAEQFVESRKMADVTNLPTFAAFDNGELVKQIQTNKAENLKELVDEVANN